MMESGNVNGAIKLLTNNIAGGILPLNEKTVVTPVKSTQKEEKKIKTS